VPGTNACRRVYQRPCAQVPGQFPIIALTGLHVWTRISVQRKVLGVKNVLIVITLLFSQQDRAADDAKSYLLHLFSPENLPNIGLLIAGIVGICVAWHSLRAIQRQGLIMIQQTRILQRQTSATEKAANAARDSAQAVLNSERAWIEIKLGPPSKDFPTDNDSVFECSIQIENHDRTVARIESVQIGADCVDGPLSQEPLNYRMQNFHTLLGSGQSDTAAGFDANDFLDWKSILNGTKRGILRIIVKYRDVVEPSTLHETAAVYVFQGRLEEPERVSSLSVYD
jgi:hypothetical protein